MDTEEFKERLRSRLETAKVGSDDNSSSSTHLFSSFFEYIGTLQIVIAFLSIATIHAVFFCLSLGNDFISIIDVVFVGNITFQFAFILALAFFSVRIGPQLISVLMSLVATSLFLLFKGFPFILINPSLIKSLLFESSTWAEFLRGGSALSTKDKSSLKRIVASYKSTFARADRIFYYENKWNRIVYPAVIFAVIIGNYYVGLPYFIFVLLVPAALVFYFLVYEHNHISYSVVEHNNELSLLDRIRSWNGQLIPDEAFFKDQKSIRSIFRFSYIYFALFAAFVGDARYDFLVKQDQLEIRTDQHRMIGHYIGSTANGAVFQVCDYNKRVILVSYDTGLMIVTTPTLKKKPLDGCIF